MPISERDASHHDLPTYGHAHGLTMTLMIADVSHFVNDAATPGHDAAAPGCRCRVGAAGACWPGRIIADRAFQQAGYHAPSSAANEITRKLRLEYRLQQPAGHSA